MEKDSNLVMATQPRVPSAPGQLLSAYTVTHSPNTFYFIFDRKEKKLLVSYCLLVMQLRKACKTPSKNHSANLCIFYFCSIFLFLVLLDPFCIKTCLSIFARVMVQLRFVKHYGEIEVGLLNQ